jgi:hypothetical protein
MRNAACFRAQRIVPGTNLSAMNNSKQKETKETKIERRPGPPPSSGGPVEFAALKRMNAQECGARSESHDPIQCGSVQPDPTEKAYVAASPGYLRELPQSRRRSGGLNCAPAGFVKFRFQICFVIRHSDFGFVSLCLPLHLISGDFPASSATPRATRAGCLPMLRPFAPGPFAMLRGPC